MAATTAAKSVVLLLLLLACSAAGFDLDALLRVPSVFLSSRIVESASFAGGGGVSEAVEFLRRRWAGVGGDIWRGIAEALLMVRAVVLVPLLQAAIWVCLAGSVVVLVDVTCLGLVSLGVKLLRLSPERRYVWKPLDGVGDEEAGSLVYPMVLVQIPMFNEKEVYKLSIGAACGLSWPSDRIIIQVLDDSTDPIIKALVELECNTWASNGVNVIYEVREGRKGFKAGALKEGMTRSYVRQCHYAAIFDSDFQPDPDFLMKTIPFLIHNPKIGLVQARWVFVNYDECFMTRFQKMSLDYHFKVEQEAGSSAFAFFGFNGTAGVWRIEAINEAGGWKDRTVVEDMDLAVRAGLKGWDFLYIGDIRVKSELPSTLIAYRHQQCRWTSGAANLFRKTTLDIMRSKEASLRRKFFIIYSFFFVRKAVARVLSFVLYCIVLPLTAVVPEVFFPTWGAVYVPAVIAIFTAIRNPRSLHLVPLWILFESVMSMLHMKSALAGLLGIGELNKWVVTEKHGDACGDKPESQLLEKSPSKLRERFLLSEVCFAGFLFLCAAYNFVFRGIFSYYIYVQAIAFLAVGLGFVGMRSNS